MDPQREYKDLLKLVDQEDKTQEDIYTELLKREGKVLDVVSRMMTQERLEDTTSTMFLNSSILDLVAKFSFTWTNIFNEMVVEKKYSDWINVLFKKERKIHVGMMFLFIAFFCFMISISQ